MSSNIRPALAARNAMVDSFCAKFDAGTGAGTLLVYNAPLPATPDTGITTQTLLGTLTMHDAAFGAATGGTATANAITSDAAADASGTPAFARGKDSSGNTVGDFTWGVSGSGACIIGAATITEGTEIAITSMTPSH